jgi:periplasmic protein TonB
MRAVLKHESMERGTGIALVVVLHAALIYALAVGLGVMKLPTFVEPMKAVIIQSDSEQPKFKTEVVKPDLATPKADMAEAVPEIPIDVPSEATPPADSAVTSAAAPSEVADLQVQHRTDPIYPPASRRAGEEGTTVLRVLVDERGRPGDVSVVQSSGFPRLDQSAVEAIRRWTFAAARNGSQTVRAYTTVRVSFRLDR